MPYDPVKNFAKVLVNGGYNSSATSINLYSGEGNKLPDPSTDGSFNLVWWNSTDYQDPSDDPFKEIVRVTARSGDTLTIVRGQDGTTAQNHNIPGKTYRMILALTKKTYDDLKTIEIFKDGSFVSQRYKLNFLTPFDVVDDTDNQITKIYPPLRFGGDGSDGNLIISSGTTNIDLGGNKIFVKNYNNLEISGNASLTFSNPHDDGTLIVFKVKGNCTITSTADPAIDLRNLGGKATRGWFDMMGGRTYLARSGADATSGAGGAGQGAISGAGGASSIARRIVYLPSINENSGTNVRAWYFYYSYSVSPFILPSQSLQYFIPYSFLPFPGGGGGNGTGYYPDYWQGAAGTPGTGGRGAGGLLIEVYGNFTGNSSTKINATGSSGTSGSGGASSGGGGGGGSVLILVNGTITGSLNFLVSGGTSDAGGQSNGADGIGLILQNKWFL